MVVVGCQQSRRPQIPFARGRRVAALVLSRWVHGAVEAVLDRVVVEGWIECGDDRW